MKSSLQGLSRAVHHRIVRQPPKDEADLRIQTSSAVQLPEIKMTKRANRRAAGWGGIINPGQGELITTTHFGGQGRDGSRVVFSHLDWFLLAPFSSTAALGQAEPSARRSSGVAARSCVRPSPLTAG